MLNLFLHWQVETAPQSALDFTTALLSLLFNQSEHLDIRDTTGAYHEDLDLHEATALVKKRVVSEVELILNSGTQKKAALVKIRTSENDTTSSVFLEFSGEARFEQLIYPSPEIEVNWLQSDIDGNSPLAVLAFFHDLDGLHPLSFHGIVGLASQFQDFRGAELRIGLSDVPNAVKARWLITQTDLSSKFTYQIYGLHDKSLWLPENCIETNEAKLDLWLEVYEQIAEPQSILAEKDFNQNLVACYAENQGDPEALQQLIQEHVSAAVILEQFSEEKLKEITFLTTPQKGSILALFAQNNSLVLAIDFEQPPEIVCRTLLHGIGHIVRGHIRADDDYGHSDTVESISGRGPLQRWDREVQEKFKTWFEPVRHIQSLDDCTNVEKAQLGLWRMIGEMIGESRRLHPLAEQYQPVIYQRQAAQRIVAMLEDYGGAMLCDGVGLGKTYVATTLMVHYANSWRDQWASTPDRLLEDPFRITVLAPNSVVSTWKREALPGLASFGVPLVSIRVISHTKVSRISGTSAILEPVRNGVSDLEHLLLSDLVIVDEAHNFRSIAARRTKVLRDLLRVQPRRESRRRVVLLTATPINNSLDDLRQEVSLLFSRSLLISDAKTDDGYRRQAEREINDRCVKARKARKKGDVSGLVIFGYMEAKFSEALDFRDDLDFGPDVKRIGDYLKEQDGHLKEMQDIIRTEAQSGTTVDVNRAPIRIAEELLDRIVVQRSRSLCKEIERQQGSDIQPLFRPDAAPPEKLYYSDEYDGIKDVLASFLPLFDSGIEEQEKRKRPPLSLKVYMWYDVREGVKDAEELSSVVGLQRVLALKRLESSPVSFLISLLRLTVLHVHRLQQLDDLCLFVGDENKHSQLQAEIQAILIKLDQEALIKIHCLATGESISVSGIDFIKSLSKAYKTDQPLADREELPRQLSLWMDLEDMADQPTKEQVNRLWKLREAIITDFETLLMVTPGLADIVFGRFDRTEWPHRFISKGETIDWPRSAAWGLRLVTDGKIRQLFNRLLLARRDGQKVIVFSQFSDTIAYVRSVLEASNNFNRAEWQIVLSGLGVPRLTSQEIKDLRDVTVAITGDTPDRDDVVNAFAPFYRIGPFRLSAEGATEHERMTLWTNWETSWLGAISKGVDVLLSSDVLAEGVNLQDTSMLINFDVHWNPVRMIQRTGRIDRRLNSRIEQAQAFPDLEELTARFGKPVPNYYWHKHPGESPITVNMILSDELEAALQLRERIATKTLAIDFTLGLEQGTGAEADWMTNYRYHGISSLNSFQKDRAIEQIASYHEKLTRAFSHHGIRKKWAENLNCWFQSGDANHGSPLIGRALLGLRGGELERFSRYIEPIVVNGIPFWFWAEKQPGESMFDGWLILDGRSENFPPRPRRDIPWTDTVALPVKASHLLAIVEKIDKDPNLVVLPATKSW
ncbi:DEAD/DEAH box helicase, partial [candidate division CSSED10-310 bacterium]